MLSNCIKNLLNLKDLIVKSVKNFENSVEIYAELPFSEQVCPCCGTTTSYIHDYYTQPIKDIPIEFKLTTVFLRKNRYECKSCSKSFYPQNNFIAKYKRKSKRLVYYVDIIECRHKHFLCSYFKKFPKKQFDRALLPSRRYKIKEHYYDELENMLINYSEDLRIAYRENECLLDIIHFNDSVEIKKNQFTEWIKRNFENFKARIMLLNQFNINSFYKLL